MHGEADPAWYFLVALALVAGIIGAWMVALASPTDPPPDDDLASSRAHDEAWRRMGIGPAPSPTIPYTDILTGIEYPSYGAYCRRDGPGEGAG